MLTEKTERRVSRITLPIPIWVERQEKNKKTWREVIPLKSVSRIGAGFHINREIEIGQLVLLTMPLPPEFRLFDHTEKDYSVWGIVRHCQPLSEKSPSTFHIGVAFIGKYPPKSYKENPLQIYNISGVRDDGFWQISEIGEFSPIRCQPRYSISVGIYLEIIDEQENILEHEKTVTENISLGGICVFSSLDVLIGKQITVRTEHSSFSATAIVRNRRIGDDYIPRLHLEFINKQFPID